jgi:hypothetical protein
MELDLIDDDRDVADVVGTAQLVGAEVRDPDVANESAIVKLRHRRQGLPEGDRGVRPVDQVEIEVGRSQPFEGVLTRLDHDVEVEIFREDFRGEEDLLPIDLHERLPDGGLVPIALGRVEMSISGIKSRPDALLGRIALEPPRPQAE